MSKIADNSTPEPEDLTRLVKQQAAELGFGPVGICPAVQPAGLDHLDQWLTAGYAGEMGYLAARRTAYDHPRHVLDGVHSIVMLALPYHTVQAEPTAPGYGRVSRYAWGEQDYHDIIRQRLHQLADALRAACPTATTRGVVDTAPLLEREFAQLAGLGWIGKNTLLINKPHGSLFFLAALLTDARLELDTPFQTDHCGTCTACLDACPTDAFPQPHVLDARRCLSYLTIELQSAIPPQLRSGLGEWLFGCDICQDVCPWNRKAPQSPLQAFQPQSSSNPMELAPLFELDEQAFRQRFRKTPLWRAHRRGLLRNAAVVLGNTQPANGVSALAIGLTDTEPMVRGACAWALGQYADLESQALLEKQRSVETDAEVQEEIRQSLAACTGGC